MFDDNIIHQEVKFKYLGIEIRELRYGNFETEVRDQAARVTRAAAHLNDAISCNKHIRIEAKTRIYKTVIRTILTYAAETRSESSKLKRLLKATDMKIVR